jgi:hypothetical protein
MVQTQAPMRAMTFVVADVTEVDSGVSAKGREWTKWLIKTTDGDRIGTFSAGWLDWIGDEVTMYVEEQMYNGRVYLSAGSPSKGGAPVSRAAPPARGRDRAVSSQATAVPLDVSVSLSRIEGAVAEIRQRLDLVLDVLHVGEAVPQPPSGDLVDPGFDPDDPGPEEPMSQDEA